MSGEYYKKMTELREKTKVNGEKLVKDEFPKKVVVLNELLESSFFSYERLKEVRPDIDIPTPEPVLLNDSEPVTKKRKVDGITNCNDSLPVSGCKVFMFPSGKIPCNNHIVEMVDKIKPHIRDLVEQSNLVKMWITYMIPKIEDGNNFGVSVQEETMAEARQVETEAATYMDQITRYFVSRGKLVSKAAKYPHVEDYSHVIKELDEKQFMSLRLTVTELRNSYCGLHDVIIKNLEKIKKPRSSNIANMF